MEQATRSSARRFRPITERHRSLYRRIDGRIGKSGTAALANRQPATLEWAIGKVGFAKNRRTPGGPVDHDLPMLVVKSAGSGAIRAIYVSYACHCVTLSNNLISGDWAGFAQKAIESKHPGTIALVSIGCGSDSNPSSGVVGDKTAVAAEQGAEIAAEVERCLLRAAPPSFWQHQFDVAAHRSAAQTVRARTWRRCLWLIARRGTTRSTNFNSSTAANPYKRRLTTQFRLGRLATRWRCYF